MTQQCQQFITVGQRWTDGSAELQILLYNYIKNSTQLL